jgi:glucose-6-phosphate 1-dehydrogenase
MNTQNQDIQEQEFFADPCEIGEGMPKPPATGVVVFGGSGDLCKRKIIPALFNLYISNLLPATFFVLGTSRRALTDEEYRNSLKESLATFSRRKVSDELWSDFSRNIYYLPLNGENQDDFETLRGRLSSLDECYGVRFSYLYYLATASNLFAPIAQNLNNVGLVADPSDRDWSTRLVVEKPFGTDAISARELNKLLLACFAESQILRVDHYLGKETIQNLLAFRFSNGIFEPLWNSNHISSIQVTVAEEIGVGSRAGYFDTSGILRDIVQNHVLQMLSLLCMESPVSLLDPDSIRDEKVKVLKNIRKVNLGEVASETMRARYGAGEMNGQELAAYVDEPGVEQDRMTETFFAWRLKIDNWRWSRVPIFIRVGKRMPKRLTEIAVVFKTPPTNMLRGCREPDPNVLSILVGPKEQMTLTLNAKMPGARYPLRPVNLEFGWDEFGVESPEAYERLLLDAMVGEVALIARGDEIEEAWKICQPVLDAWANDPSIRLEEYPAGTWPDASRLIRPNEGAWRDLDSLQF